MPCAVLSLLLFPLLFLVLLLYPPPLLPPSSPSPPLFPLRLSSSFASPLVFVSSSSILVLLKSSSSPPSLLILLLSLHVLPPIPRRFACPPSRVSLPTPPRHPSSSEIEKTLRNHYQGVGNMHSNSDRAHCRRRNRSSPFFSRAGSGVASPW